VAGLILIARERCGRLLEQPREAREHRGVFWMRACVGCELDRHRGAVHGRGAPPGFAAIAPAATSASRSDATRLRFTPQSP